MQRNLVLNGPETRRGSVDTDGSGSGELPHAQQGEKSHFGGEWRDMNFVSCGLCFDCERGTMLKYEYRINLRLGVEFLDHCLTVWRGSLFGVRARWWIGLIVGDSRVLRRIEKYALLHPLIGRAFPQQRLVRKPTLRIVLHQI